MLSTCFRSLSVKRVGSSARLILFNTSKRPFIISAKMSQVQDDIKTFAVFSESELADGQMKEVPFGENGKVLLSRLGDKIHATSAFCTHYGAPLAKGVLESSGRLVCPWHGACFNVCTGDIEDSPAPDAIHSFRTTTKDGQIYVTASQAATLKNNKARPPRSVRVEELVQTGPGVVIVGGGAGGFHAAQSLRENDYKGPITIISSEGYAPIDRTRLSKALVTDPSKLEWRTPQTLKDQFGINLVLNTTVTAVNTSEKNITIGGSNEQVPYRHLVLAPGSTPKRLPIKGADLNNVYTLRQVPDAKNIDAALKPGKKLAVIGSSFIAMELANAVSKRELASIDVVGMDEIPFEKMLGKQVGSSIMKFLEKNGIKFHMKAKITSLYPSSSDPSYVGGIALEDGTKIEADVVVMGVGVRPATDFLKSSGFKVEDDGGLKVDDHLRVEGVRDVFAIGDIAIYPQAQDGTPRRIEHWNVANNHGRSVGATIGRTPELAVGFSKVPIFWSSLGQQLRYCGLGAQFDDIIIKGSAEDLKFVAYYAKEGKIVAVSSMQSDPAVAKCAELLRLGLMPSADEIKAGKDPLTVNIAVKTA